MPAKLAKNPAPLEQRILNYDMKQLTHLAYGGARDEMTSLIARAEIKRRACLMVNNIETK